MLKSIIDNGFQVWLKRVLLAFFTSFLFRLIFVTYNFQYFSPNGFAELPKVLFYGLLFDFQAWVYLLALFHLLSLFPFNPFLNKKWFQMILKITFFVGIFAFIIINSIDLEFFKLKNRRTGIEIFSLMADKSNPISSYFISFWYIIIALLLLFFGLVKLYPQLNADDTTIDKKFSIKKMALFLMAVIILFLGARGGMETKPIRSFDASRFVSPEWSAATINSFTQLLTSLNAGAISQLYYFDKKTCIAIAKPYKSEPALFSKSKPNVVLIILESFGRDYCGFLNDTVRFTPFLDSLAKKSLIFSNAYSNGATSIESLPAIFTSLPSLLDVPYINSNFQNNTLRGVHYYLNKNKYDCSFYYGAENGSMGFQNFLKTSGPMKYYGINEYPNKVDYDGSWGIWDDKYLQYYAKELGKKQQPFFSSVFTLSSHHPYKVPKNLELQFEEGDLPIHKSVRYADYSLKLFFEQCEKQDWFKNTVFIITADHSSYSTTEYFYSPSGKFEVPLLFYSPKYFKPQTIDSMTVSHCDIFPSIMSICGIRDSFVSLGNNVFKTKNSYSLNYENGWYQLTQYPYCLRINQEGKVKMHMQTKQMLVNRDAVTVFNDSILNYKKELTDILKAKQQFYNNRLIINQFYIKE